MDRSILHMDLDAFFVSCERLLDSRLQGRPVLIGGTGGRGVVSAASYEARPFGVHSGMPMKMARVLCPEAVVIRGNAGTYTKFSREVTDILRERVPLLEKSSIDEFYADMTGMDRFHGIYKYASEMRQAVIKETGLPISFGLAVNKTVSKVATNEAKPNNQLKVAHGLEKIFLAPLSVKKIPMIGDKTFQQLCNLGLKQVSHIQQMPVEAMQQVFGKHGLLMWERANGVDKSPVVAYHERKSISNERTFGKDTIDIPKLETTLSAMVENLAYKLRKANKVAACVSVKIRYSDFNTYSKQQKIPYTAADHILLPTTLELFHKLYDRRLRIRLIGVRFSDLTGGNYQISLFEDASKTVQLYRAMDRIRERYGSRTVMRASTFGARSIGNDFDPFNGEPPIVLAHRTR
ncbi:MAG: DNA polymerase IV [Flavobacteriaceae bacterium]|nr:DNA polymerase IV [Flavobacteriaceae bacterium]